jgi:hypothetical protein
MEHSSPVTPEVRRRLVSARTAWPVPWEGRIEDRSEASRRNPGVCTLDQKSLVASEKHRITSTVCQQPCMKYQPCVGGGGVAETRPAACNARGSIVSVDRKCQRTQLASLQPCRGVSCEGSRGMANFIRDTDTLG